MGGEEITRKVRVSLTRFVCADFPASGNKNVVFRSGTGGEYFTYFSSSDKKSVCVWGLWGGTVMGGQSDLPASALFEK